MEHSTDPPDVREHRIFALTSDADIKSYVLARLADYGWKSFWRASPLNYDFNSMADESADVAIIDLTGPEFWPFENRQSQSVADILVAKVWDHVALLCNSPIPEDVGSIGLIAPMMVTNQRRFPQNVTVLSPNDVMQRYRRVEYLKLCKEIALSWLEQQTGVASKVLSGDEPEHSIVLSFDLPDEVRSACEQYLVFFSQFLQDVGLSATNDIRHDEAGRILFSVTPTDSKSALGAIREALNTYLQLPAKIRSDDFTLNDAPEVQRMAANLHHLRGQLLLAASMMEARETTIQAQALAIQILTSQAEPTDLLVNSTTTPSASWPSDKEVLLGGIVKIGDAEIGKLGVSISLAEIYRRCRERFGKKP